MKKRLLSILLISALSFALCACGETATEATATAEESIQQQTTAEEPTTQPTEEPEQTEEPQATEQSEPEATEEPQATEEVATVEPEQTETPPEPTVEPTPTYTYTDMSATMYAKQSVNVRTLPSTDGEKVGSLSTNQEVNITGQCNETGWYRFEYNGSTAYVSNNYVSENKVEIAQQPDTTTQSASSSTSSAYNLDDYPVGEWVDMGDWFFYINNSTDMPAPTTSSFWGDIKAILQERYPDKEVGSAGGVKIASRNQSVWFVNTASQTFTSFFSYVYSIATQ